MKKNKKEDRKEKNEEEEERKNERKKERTNTSETQWRTVKHVAMTDRHSCTAASSRMAASTANQDAFDLLVEAASPAVVHARNIDGRNAPTLGNMGGSGSAIGRAGVAAVIDEDCRRFCGPRTWKACLSVRLLIAKSSRFGDGK